MIGKQDFSPLPSIDTIDTSVFIQEKTGLLWLFIIKGILAHITQKIEEAAKNRRLEKIGKYFGN